MKFHERAGFVLTVAVASVAVSSCREKVPAVSATKKQEHPPIVRSDPTPFVPLSLPPTSKQNGEESQDAVLDPASDWPSVLSLAKKNLPAAIALFDNYDSSHRGRLLSRLVTDLATDDLNKLPTLLSILPKTSDKQDAIQAVSSHWAYKDVNKLIEFGRAQPSGMLKNIAYEKSSQALLNQNSYAEVATLIANEMPFSTNRNGIIGDLASRWAEHDPAAVTAWIKGLDSQDRQLASLRVIDGIGDQKGIAGLIGYANEANDESVQHACIMKIVELMPISTDAKATQDWINSLPKPLKQTAISTFVTQRGENDPAVWSNYVLTNVTDKVQKSSIIRNLTQSIATDDPEKAAAFAMTLQDNTIKRDALATVVRQWYRDDTEACSSWVTSLPAGVERNGALSVLARQIGQSDLATAKSIAAQITDAVQRDHTLKDLR